MIYYINMICTPIILISNAYYACIHTYKMYTYVYLYIILSYSSDFSIVTQKYEIILLTYFYYR